LYDYERKTREAFDAIVPALKKISAMQHEDDFERRAQQLAREQLGFNLPDSILADAWIDQLDMRRLFAWCVFQTYQQFCDEFFTRDPIGMRSSDEFQSFLQECGFHTLDISPCADGRLAHVISYVLRLPYKAVRRKSYAGALFDIEDSLEKWTETEMLRFREGRPNTADAPTRYLKSVIYHYSSVDPEHEGCAAHGSDTLRAAQAGVDRLLGFQQAVENSFCCGASIDLMLIGLDTDTDAIRIHATDQDGRPMLDRYIDTLEVFDKTRALSASEAEAGIAEGIEQTCTAATDGMKKLMNRLAIQNLSQIDYVRGYHGSHYSDIGHAERFIGAGIGFEEIQLRNLTYFAYLNTVEEATKDLDVGIKIFTGLNIARGLPIPVVVRYDYHGQVPGARERAIEHCNRVVDALGVRYADLVEQGLLHTLLVIRDCHAGACIEVLSSSADPQMIKEAH
jgi:carboxysome shell carbonic anhydrase